MTGDALRSTAATVVVAALGLGVLSAWTSGLRAFTSEAARRIAVAEQPRALPEVPLEDASGRRFTWSALAGHPLLVAFVYTRCTGACPLLTARLRAIDRAVAGGRLPAGLRLVAITLDPAHDTRAVLAAHARAMGADGERWRFARTVGARDLAALTRAFGVVVIADGRGGLQHNVALHLVDGEGRLARILDADATPDALAAALASL